MLSLRLSAFCSLRLCEKTGSLPSEGIELIAAASDEGVGVGNIGGAVARVDFMLTEN
jgi:hypothetical protein